MGFVCELCQVATSSPPDGVDSETCIHIQHGWWQRIARAAFPKGNVYIRMLDELGVFFDDQ
jgi:hypothetical protein